jgi:hypothetical protein
MRIFVLILSLIIFIITSCGNNSSTGLIDFNNKIENLTKINYDSINYARSEILSTRYKSITYSDTSLIFSYQIQNKIEKDSNTLALKGYVNDILKKNNQYYLTISCEFLDENCIVELLIPDGIKDGVIKSFNSHFVYDREGCFIVAPNYLSSTSRFKVDSYVSEGEAELIYDFENSIRIIKGTLVDYYKYLNE